MMWADVSLSVYFDNKNKDILIIGEAQHKD